MTPPEEKSASLRTAAVAPDQKDYPNQSRQTEPPATSLPAPDPVIVEDPGKNNTKCGKPKNLLRSFKFSGNCPDPPRHEHDKG